MRALRSVPLGGKPKTPQSRINNYLPREHPNEAKSLTSHQAAPRKIVQIGVEVVAVGLQDIEQSHEIKRQYGFLTNDALLVAVMQRSAVTPLASNDPDFERVPVVALYRPIPGK